MLNRIFLLCVGFQWIAGLISNMQREIPCEAFHHPKEQIMRAFGLKIVLLTIGPPWQPARELIKSIGMKSALLAAGLLLFAVWSAQEGRGPAAV